MNHRDGQNVASDGNLLNLSLDDLFRDLGTSPAGLASDEAEKRLEKYGPNVLEEKKVNPILKFLSYFWGPIPWMIEVAALLSAIVRHIADLIIILVLLVFNGIVGFWQEHKAANAVEALKKQLALKARVRRDGAWREIDAALLVPGDIVRVRPGDIIPADLKLAEGDYLSVDQSALTGESLPVDKKTGDAAFSGSIAKQGEMAALVVTTGAATYFGKTARMVETAKPVSHFQKAVLQIGDYLIYLSLGLVAILVLAMLLRGASLLTLVQFALILVVAAIPVAMPAVLSVTMAIGAMALARMKAIVTRLESIEEMAGIDILCTDKTGTMTQNRLTLGDAALFAAASDQDLIFTAALASKEEDRDAIDMAVIQALQDPKAINTYRQEAFVPFDPVRKRTEATIRDAKGGSFKVSKGAPQVMLELCRPNTETIQKAKVKVEEFARQGYRTLGVARQDREGKWQFLGLLPLFDPPRADAAETIRSAQAYGVEVKMVTGDNLAIAKQIAAQLKLGTNIRLADEFFAGSTGAENHIPEDTAKRVEGADGFAQVFPEHKFTIVKALQERGHIVGMTGDGVNDAPALGQANAGIAVSGATDAARAAAALVLTAQGISVIVRAIEEARKIFERMTSYAIYRITETIRIMFFVVLTMIAFNFYPITTVMIILLALLNDLPIMSIAYDNTWLEPKPVRWAMRRVLTVATTLGLVGVISTFGLLLIARLVMDLSVPQIQSLIYLKLTVAGHLTLFVARTRRPFYSAPYPAPILLAAVLSTQTIAVLLVGFGILVAPLPWSYIILVWVYALFWLFVVDRVKMLVYRHGARPAGAHPAIPEIVRRAFHPLSGAMPQEK